MNLCLHCPAEAEGDALLPVAEEADGDGEGEGEAEADGVLSADDDADAEALLCADADGVEGCCVTAAGATLILDVTGHSTVPAVSVT